MATNKKNQERKRNFAVTANQSIPNLENQNLNELPKFSAPLQVEDLPIDTTEINKLIENLGERFEIKQLIGNNLNDQIYYGVYRISGSRITIQFTRQTAVFEKACKWQTLENNENKFEKIIEAGKLDFGYFYIVSQMSVHPNRTLLADNQRLSPRQAVDLICQICDAITELNSEGLFYGELDPTNVIYLSQNETVKLCEVRRPFFRQMLGVLVENNEIESIKPIESNEIEIRAVAYQTDWLDNIKFPDLIHRLLLHTPLSGWMYTLLNPFIAPECVMQEGDERSDVYSIGGLLYWLLTGKNHIDLINQFESQSVIQDLLPDNLGSHNILKLVLEPLYIKKLSETNYDTEKVPFELRAVLLKALNNNPENRYATSQALREALENLTLNSLIVTAQTTKGKHIKGAKVIVTQKDAKEILNTQTNMIGQAHFEKLYSGIYEINVLHKDFFSSRPQIISVHIGSPVKEIEFNLEPIGLLSKFFNLNKHRKEE